MNENEAFTLKTFKPLLSVDNNLYSAKINVPLAYADFKLINGNMVNFGEKYYFKTESDMLLFKLKYSEYITDCPEYDFYNQLIAQKLI